LNQQEVIITTNDSRLRLVNLDECLRKVKFKGFKGENLQLRCSLNKNDTRISMGSEDGNIFIWDIEKTGSNHYKDAKQKAYEFFNPFLISKLDQEEKINQAKVIEEPIIEVESHSDDDDDAQEQSIQ
jgi:ribosomal protein S11